VRRNLKIDKVIIWKNGKKADGKTGMADFLSGLICALLPLHELARNSSLASICRLHWAWSGGCCRQRRTVKIR
jgi:NAD(P)H-hydrate repair Nnr-like enzyme with NAD(P)H-hydrate dehydratase domain